MIRHFARKQRLVQAQGSVLMNAGFSWCGWFRPEEMSVGNIKPVFMLGTAANKGALRITFFPLFKQPGCISVSTRNTEGASYFGSVSWPVKEEWIFVGITKASGESVPKFYMYVPSTKTWTVEQLGEKLKDPFTVASGRIWFGDYMDTPENEEFSYKGDMAAQAVWNSVLTEEQMKSLPTMANVEKWKTLSPTAMWSFGQEEVGETVYTLIRDWVGGGVSGGSFFVENKGTTVLAQAPPQPYSTKEQITHVLPTDSLKHAALEANFTKLPWLVSAGSWSATTGWKPESFLANPPTGGRAGWYVNNKLITGGNACSGFKISSESSGGAGRQKSAWLFVPASPGVTATGYQLALVFTAEATKLQVVLREFKEGTLIASAELPAFVMPGAVLTADVMLTCVGGVLEAWWRKTQSEEWESILELKTTSYIEGRGGMDGNGSNPTFLDYRIAALEGPAPLVGGKTVKIIREGSLVEGKRWVLSGGVLVNA